MPHVACPTCGREVKVVLETNEIAVHLRDGARCPGVGTLVIRRRVGAPSEANPGNDRDGRRVAGRRRGKYGDDELLASCEYFDEVGGENRFRPPAAACRPSAAAIGDSRNLGGGEERLEPLGEEVAIGAVLGSGGHGEGTPIHLL